MPTSNPPRSTPLESGLPDSSRLDPTFLNARREAIVIFLTWCVTLVWSVSMCYWLGYGASVADLKTVWGIPSWVFWGIVIPWTTAVVFSLWFSLAYMTDDDLSGQSAPNSEGSA